MKHINNKEITVGLYSASQNAFHVETMEEHQDYLIEIALQGKETDYRVIISSTEEKEVRDYIYAMIEMRDTKDMEEYFEEHVYEKASI